MITPNLFPSSSGASAYYFPTPLPDLMITNGHGILGWFVGLFGFMAYQPL